ncbi:hypothetical protein MCEMSHM24_02707 [Comamonadaceae bacterium]
MIEILRQRLASKTYRAAIIMALLSALEVNMQLVTPLLPANLQPYLVLVWVPVMLTLREVTTAALGDK